MFVPYKNQILVVNYPVKEKKNFLLVLFPFKEFWKCAHGAFKAFVEQHTCRMWCVALNYLVYYNIVLAGW